MFPHYEHRNNENISKHRCCGPYSRSPKRITTKGGGNTRKSTETTINKGNLIKLRRYWPRCKMVHYGAKMWFCFTIVSPGQKQVGKQNKEMLIYESDKCDYMGSPAKGLG